MAFQLNSSATSQILLFILSFITSNYILNLTIEGERGKTWKFHQQHHRHIVMTSSSCSVWDAESKSFPSQYLILSTTPKSSEGNQEYSVIFSTMHCVIFPVVDCRSRTFPLTVTCRPEQPITRFGGHHPTSGANLTIKRSLGRQTHTHKKHMEGPPS